MEDVKRVALLGANSLIGQHLLSQLLHLPEVEVHLWTFQEKFTYRLAAADNNNDLGSALRVFVGYEQLESAIHGCDTVFNMHEFQDFSVCPNRDMLEENNVDFIQRTLSICGRNGVSRIIHLSSVYLQCSAWWPNVYNREADASKFLKEVPFPAYCQSKAKAEEILREQDQMQTVCARVGAVYGEGDRCSVVCDALTFSHYAGAIPQIGDKSGVFQMTYAGNVAYALLLCWQAISSDAHLRHETVLIQDDTPIWNIYDLIVDPIASRNAAYQKGWICDKLGVHSRLKEMPSPSYLYLVIRHWTFVNGFKLRVLFNYIPKFEFAEAMRRSRDYYAQLKPSDVKFMSWKSQPL